MKQILSIDDPEIQEFTNLKSTFDSTFKEKTIIISSKKALDKAILNNIMFDKIFINEVYLDDYKNQENIYFCTKKLMEKITGYKLHQGIFAKAKYPNYHKLSLLDNKILVLNGLTSPENVGSIVRSAIAFGFTSIIYDSKCCSPYLQRCIRVSLGNIFYSKVFKSINLRDDLNLLKKMNYQIYSSANIDFAKEVKSVQIKNKFALIIGSEGHGIEKNILEVSDHILKIVISDETAHLNASIAAAILMSQLNTN